MKKYLILTAIAAFALAAAPITVACAKSAPAVEKLSKEELLELQVISMQLDDLQRRATDAAKPLFDRRAEILKGHGLDWQKMGPAGAEQSVAPDGTITRKAPASPDMGAPAEKGKK